MNPLSLLSAGQGILGVAQFFGGLLSKPKHRPTYDISPEFEKNVGLARELKNQGMPQEEYARAAQNILRNQSAGVNALQDRRSALMGIGSLIQRSNDAALGLDSFAANLKSQNFRLGTQMEIGANNALGQQKLQKMQWEKLQPYMDKLNQSQALMGAGLQNFSGAAQTQMQYDFMNKAFPTLNPKKTAR